MRVRLPFLSGDANQKHPGQLAPKYRSCLLKDGLHLTARSLFEIEIFKCTDGAPRRYASLPPRSTFVSLSFAPCPSYPRSTLVPYSFYSHSTLIPSSFHSVRSAPIRAPQLVTSCKHPTPLSPTDLRTRQITIWERI